MPVTAHRAVSRLLRYFSDAEQVLPPPAQYADRWQICAEAINAAFSEFALALGKSFQSMRERGWMFDGPQSVTVALTKGSRTATITSSADLLGSNVTGRLLTIGAKDFRIHWQSAYAYQPFEAAMPAVAATTQSDWVTNAGLVTGIIAIFNGPTQVLYVQYSGNTDQVVASLQSQINQPSTGFTASFVGNTFTITADNNGIYAGAAANGLLAGFGWVGNTDWDPETVVFAGGENAIPEVPESYTYVVELVDEWTGESTTTTATLHNDARILESDVLSVDSISNDTGLPLDPVGSDLGALRIMGGPTRDFGFERRRNVRRWAATARMSTLAGQMPQCYSVRQPKPESSPSYVLTVYPPPSTTTVFRARILTGPFSLDIATIGTGNLVTNLTAITLPISDAMFDAVIFPIAAQRLTGSPNFRNDSAVGEISRLYQAAILALEKLRAQAPPRGTLFPS
jgi:hypothetical protein